MTKTRSWGARAAAVAAAVGLLVGVGGVVDAQPSDAVDVAFNIAEGGVISIPGVAEDVAIPIPDPNPAQVVGSWSPTTGAFTGNLTGEILKIEVLTFLVDASLTSTSVTGVIPPDGSEGTVTIEGLALRLSLPPLLDCTLPVGNVELDAVLIPGEPVGLALGGAFDVSVAPVPPGCDLLGTLLPPGTTSLPVELGLSLAQVTTPEPPAPEPPAPEPEVAKPAFTG